ncbi:hypothetical protein VTN49DRAFT_2024 [Thermomyces lanuginosus]|uniref:uncharacterized protein n=1 Tax=Thermomyces lanuginosus TaxID=5541 RepID=UPI003744AB33
MNRSRPCMDARYTDEGEGYQVAKLTRRQKKSLTGGGCRVSPVRVCFWGRPEGDSGGQTAAECWSVQPTRHTTDRQKREDKRDEERDQHAKERTIKCILGLLSTKVKGQELALERKRGGKEDFCQSAGTSDSSGSKTVRRANTLDPVPMEPMMVLQCLFLVACIVPVGEPRFCTVESPVSLRRTVPII